MTTHQLDQVQRLIDELSPLEQAQLLEHLALKVTQVIAARQGASGPVLRAGYEQAWKEFFRLGGELAASDTPEVTTLTQAVLSMRR